MTIPSVPKPENPAFLDVVIGELQDVLKLKLSWLKHSFGKCQRLTKIRENREYYYPAIHLKRGEYVSLLPEQTLGNFSFFVISDPQNIDFNKNQFNTIKPKFSIIFWFNLDTIILNSNDRNIEALKAQILRVLTRETFLKKGTFTIEQIYEQSENIYKGFSLKEVDTQFLMQPYGGLRFEGELTFRELC